MFKQETSSHNLAYSLSKGHIEQHRCGDVHPFSPNGRGITYARFDVAISFARPKTARTAVQPHTCGLSGSSPLLKLRDNLSFNRGKRAFFDSTLLITTENNEKNRPLAG